MADGSKVSVGSKTFVNLYGKLPCRRQNQGSDAAFRLFLLKQQLYDGDGESGCFAGSGLGTAL